jgi:hypothetical protein
VDRLAEILVDMLRSSLAWEKERGVTQQNDKFAPANALTGIREAYKLSHIKDAGKGDGNEGEDNSQKHESHDDFRGPEGTQG